uniref:Uncharacterized protein n=1 Tax=Timema cristinae TaxID=61476 RepID=A0A7R9DNB8_TIMCR|nr:unnamed protein product [Timema cristinae]
MHGNRSKTVHRDISAVSDVLMNTSPRKGRSLALLECVAVWRQTSRLVTSSLDCQVEELETVWWRSWRRSGGGVGDCLVEELETGVGDCQVEELETVSSERVGLLMMI